MAWPNFDDYKELVAPETRTAVDDFSALLQGYLAGEHKDDGSHATINADLINIHSAGVFLNFVSTLIPGREVIVGTWTQEEGDTLGNIRIVFDMEDAESWSVRGNQFSDGATLADFGVIENLMPEQQVHHALSVTGRLQLVGQSSYSPPPNDTNALADSTRGPLYSYYRVTPAAARTIFGIYTLDTISGARGQAIVIANDSAFNLTLGHNSTATAARRILCPNAVDLVLGPGASAIVVYDSDSSVLRWRVIGTTTGAGGITALTGDVTATGPGSAVATIANSAVTYPKIQNPTSSQVLLGRGNTGAGIVQELTLGSSLSMSGAVVSVADLGITTAKIADSNVTYAKIQNVSNSNFILGRTTGGPGQIVEIDCTAAGRALIDDADAAAQRTTLGLGTLATQSGTFSGTSSGTNTGDQTITLTGEVTGTGTGSFAATIANNAITTAKILNDAVTTAKIADANVTKAKIENVTAGRLLGRGDSGAGAPQEIEPSNASFDVVGTTLLTQGTTQNETNVTDFDITIENGLIKFFTKN